MKTKQSLISVSCLLLMAFSLFVGCSDMNSEDYTELQVVTNPTDVANGAKALECGTVSPPPPTWLFATRAYGEALPFMTYQFRLYIHIIRSSTGGCIATPNVTNLINTLNSFYNGSNISFTLTGVEYIDNNKYYYLSGDNETTKNELLKFHNHSDAIDIYVISDGLGMGGLYGQASGIPATSLLVNGTRYNTETVAHEIGHCLGLYHTHHGTSINERNSTTTPELVDGSNSIIAGDYIVDTPADPGIWDSGVYAGGTLTDANGDTYKPDPTNMMSYNTNHRTTFTVKQCEHIYRSIINTTVLLNTATIFAPSISGDNYIHSPHAYSIELPSGYQANWNVKVESFTSKTSATVTYLTGSGNTFTITPNTTNAVSQKFTLTTSVINGKGVEFQNTKIVRHTVPSSKTGTLRWGSEAPGNSSYTQVGNMDMDKGYSVNTLKAYQGGFLYFYYTDANEADSNNSNYFNFEIQSCPSSITKVSGDNNAFFISNNASVSSYDLQLVVRAGTYVKIIPFRIQILAR